MIPAAQSSALLKSLICFFLLFSLAPKAFPQTGATVAPASLNYLVDNAETIVRGYVVSAALEAHPQFSNLPTVLVTVSVAKTFKGQSVSTLTFRQILLESKDSGGVGGYHKAEELLLFLNPISPHGLTSPVGMEQGRFRVLRDKKGSAYALNGRGNVGLFAGVLTTSTSRGARFTTEAKAMLDKSSGQVPLSTLEQTIQALLAVHP